MKRKDCIGLQQLVVQVAVVYLVAVELYRFGATSQHVRITANYDRARIVKEVSRSASDSGEMDITPREVLEEFKCPVCVEYMTPPIPMCQNGHNICNTCRQKVNRCPTCRQQFSESRCWLLENIIQKMKYRCQYYKEGCDFVSTAEFIKSHEAECRDRPFNCPFSVVVTENCCWRGHISGMWRHILCKHTALAEPKESIFLTVDCAERGPWHRALHAKDETFLMVCRVINMVLHCCVLYVGPQERAPYYSYRVTIKTKRGSGPCTVWLPTPSYFVDVETLFRNCSCPSFSSLFYSECCNGSTRLMSFQVEIR